MKWNCEPRWCLIGVVLIVGLSLVAAAQATVETGWTGPNVPRNPTDAHIGFENGVDLQPIQSEMTGIVFTSAGNYPWAYCDVRSGNWNYPAYYCIGNFWAEVYSGGSYSDYGRIDFTEADASYVSLLASTYYGVEVDAYDSGGNFIATSGRAGNNLFTYTMTRLTVETPDGSHSIAYVIVHDTGNYWVVDEICTDASGVEEGGTNTPPTVVTDTALSGVEGSPITFDATGSSDADGDTLTFAWDFDGDGTVDSSDASCTHVYPDNGVYAASLAVSDGTDTVTTPITVTVGNVEPTVGPITLVQPNPQFILPKVHRLTFQGTFTDPGADTWTYEWDFGDGTPTVTGSLAAIAPLSTRHIFGVSGDYTVTLTVRDDDGGQGSATFMIHVTDEYGALADLKAYVQDLPSGAFSGNAASLKAMLSSQFNALEVKLQHNDYPGFIRDIQTIRAKADGEKIGRVRDDWIIDKMAQQHVCMKIDDLVAYVKTRM